MSEQKGLVLAEKERAIFLLQLWFEQLQIFSAWDFFYRLKNDFEIRKIDFVYPLQYLDVKNFLAETFESGDFSPNYEKVTIQKNKVPGRCRSLEVYCPVGKDPNTHDDLIFPTNKGGMYAEEDRAVMDTLEEVIERSKEKEIAAQKRKEESEERRARMMKLPSSQTVGIEGSVACPKVPVGLDYEKIRKNVIEALKTTDFGEETNKEAEILARKMESNAIPQLPQIILSEDTISQPKEIVDLFKVEIGLGKTRVNIPKWIVEKHLIVKHGDTMQTGGFEIWGKNCQVSFLATKDLTGTVLLKKGPYKDVMEITNVNEDGSFDVFLYSTRGGTETFYFYAEKLVHPPFNPKIIVSTELLSNHDCTCLKSSGDCCNCRNFPTLQSLEVDYRRQRMEEAIKDLPARIEEEKKVVVKPEPVHIAKEDVSESLTSSKILDMVDKEDYFAPLDTMAAEYVSENAEDEKGIDEMLFTGPLDGAKEIVACELEENEDANATLYFPEEETWPIDQVRKVISRSGKIGLGGLQNLVLVKEIDLEATDLRYKVATFDKEFVAKYLGVKENGLIFYGAFQIQGETCLVIMPVEKQWKLSDDKGGGKLSIIEEDGTLDVLVSNVFPAKKGDEYFYVYAGRNESNVIIISKTLLKTK